MAQEQDPNRPVSSARILVEPKGSIENLCVDKGFREAFIDNGRHIPDHILSAAEVKVIEIP